jgi:hypothetical protein
MLQIPYAAVATGIAVLLGVWAIVEAESSEGRIALAALMAAIFFVPVFWRNPTGRLIGLIAWAIFGIGCYVFVKLKGVAI